MKKKEINKVEMFEYFYNMLKKEKEERKDGLCQCWTRYTLLKECFGNYIVYNTYGESYITHTPHECEKGLYSNMTIVKDCHMDPNGNIWWGNKPFQFLNYKKEKGNKNNIFDFDIDFLESYEEDEEV